MKTQKIILAADHAGFALKETIKKFLQEKGYEILDVGAHELVEGDDYPVYMSAAAMKVAEDYAQGRPTHLTHTKAILFGGSGQGEAMVANRFRGVRAAVWYGGNLESLTKSREHNDANVLSIGARFVTEETAKEGIMKWLETPFNNEERHGRRIGQMDSIE